MSVSPEDRAEIAAQVIAGCYVDIQASIASCQNDDGEPEADPWPQVIYELGVAAASLRLAVSYEQGTTPKRVAEILVEEYGYPKERFGL